MSTGVESRTGLAFSMFDTTMVATCPPFPPLIPDVSLPRASSHSMMICPPELYHDVACTAGMNLAKKVSVSASWEASVSIGTPVWPSSVRFGVYHTKSGGFGALRSSVKVDASTTPIFALGKYSHGLCLTA